MTNADRIAVIRERLGPCQMALRALLDNLAAEYLDGCRAEAEALWQCFLELEAAIGAPSTPPSLFNS
jgi:hypothetical protein